MSKKTAPLTSVKPRIMQMITRMIRGGAQQGVVLITDRLLKGGYSVVLAHGPGNDGLLETLPKNKNLELLYVPEFRRRIFPFLDLLAFFRIWRYLAAHPVDLVHTHTSKAGIVGRWAAFFARVPVIIHSPRGSIYHEIYYSKFIQTLLAFVERLTALTTDKILTLCESEKFQYIGLGIAPAKKFTTIYSGTEIKRYIDVRPDIAKKKAELKIPTGRPVVGYISRMTPEKGHLMCLDVFERILKEIPQVVLVLVGDGPLEEEVKQKIKKQAIEDRVIITGARTDVAEILQTFDCFLQTSLWDGLPRAMIEAMLGEKPVVAAAVGGIPEVIHHGKTGILAAPEDEEGLARGVIEVLRDPEKSREIGKNARRRMEEVFDVDASVEKMFALYEVLLAEKKHSSSSSPHDFRRGSSNIDSRLRASGNDEAIA